MTFQIIAFIISVMNTLESVHQRLENIKRETDTGVEFWMAREIQSVLGYDKFDNFENVIQRAITACASSEQESAKHFLETRKKVAIGSGAQVMRKDYFLSRYACYLIAMNGDTAKPHIGIAQTYFAVKTREQEVSEQQGRLDWREKVKQATKELTSAANAAGVKHFGWFHEAGYRGLYNMPLAAIKQRKGLAEGDNLFDHSGLTELAANAFRATQTKEALKARQVRSETKANETHFEIGQTVRKTMEAIGGTMPENLRAQPSIKRIAARKEKQLISPPKEISLPGIDDAIV
ncbi:MAG: DNA damage-inducible protein D [Verrucomicrobiota bacterium]